jgi:hypothetical protein
MLSRCSNSLIFLALAMGVVLPCVTPFSARAGDKIEFSAPGALDVPRPEREDKEPSKADEFQPPARPDAQVMDDMEPGPSEVVIISTAKKKDSRTADSAFTDDRYNDAEVDKSDTDLDSKQRTTISTIDRWDTQRQNSDRESIFSNKRSNRSASEDNLRSRLEAVNTEGRTDYQRDERYGKHVPDSSENTAWPHSFFNHGLTGLERMREGQFVPFYEEVNAASQVVNQSLPTRSATAADDLLRNSTLAPGMAAYDAQVDAMRGKTPDGTMAAPRTYYPVPAARVVSPNPDVYARQEPPASPSGQVQSRPAILPYPKKPGDVLR